MKLALEEMIKGTKLELEKRKQKVPLEEMAERAIKKCLGPKKVSYLSELKQPLRGRDTALIAEVKPYSPTRRIDTATFDLKKLIKEYEKYAQTISIVTNAYFKGSLQLLENASKLTYKPLLCKDFIIDKYQIYEARAYGAHAVLLMMNILDNKLYYDLFTCATALGMDSQVEVHNEKELEQALSLSSSIIGINNRNFKTFEVDITTTIKLAPKVPGHVYLVSESGIRDKKAYESVKDYVNAVHIGTTLMKTKDVGAEIRKIMGLKNEGNA